MKQFFYIILLLILANSSLASNIFDLEEDQEITISDPFETYNRKIYDFNIFIDKYSLKPIAKIYRKTTSDAVRSSISNVIRTATLPFNIISSLIQLDFKNSFIATSEFTINATVGLLGIYDVAGFKNIHANNEDLASAMAHYNIGSGPYLMIPFLGPRSLRHLTGDIAQSGYHPIFDAALDRNHQKTEYTLNSANVIATRERLFDELEQMQKNSLDPYSVLKSAYYQSRLNMTK